MLLHDAWWSCRVSGLKQSSFASNQIARHIFIVLYIVVTCTISVTIYDCLRTYLVVMIHSSYLFPRIPRIIRLQYPPNTVFKLCFVSCCFKFSKVWPHRQSLDPREDENKRWQGQLPVTCIHRLSIDLTPVSCDHNPCKTLAICCI